MKMEEDRGILILYHLLQFFQSASGKKIMILCDRMILLSVQEEWYIQIISVPGLNDLSNACYFIYLKMWEFNTFEF